MYYVFKLMENGNDVNRWMLKGNLFVEWGIGIFKVKNEDRKIKCKN